MGKEYLIIFTIYSEMHLPHLGTAIERVNKRTPMVGPTRVPAEHPSCRFSLQPEKDRANQPQPPVILLLNPT